MAYEVRTPVYEGPFDLLLHLILSEEVDLWEVSLADDRRRVPRRGRAPRPPRPRRRHRVPADRGDAGRAEGPPAPARRVDDSSSTRSCCASRSATSCWPGCSSARRSRTPPRALEGRMRRRRAVVPAGRRSRGAVPLAGAGPARAGHARALLRPRRAGPGTGAQPVRSSTPTTSRRSGPASRDAVETVLRLAARRPADDASARFVGARPTASRSIVRFLAVPRALQAGRRRPRAGRRTSASCGSGGSPALGEHRARRSTASLDRATRDDEPAAECERRRAGTRGRSIGRRAVPVSERVERRERGSARRAIEAVLMAATEPVEPRPARAAGRDARSHAVEAAVRRARGRVRATTAAASCSPASPAATASRPIPTSRPTSSASCSRASTPGCRRRRSRRWRSSPTSSRSRAARSRRSAA